ncbi:CsbD family protein [Lamprobacter modestohalophilus]|uniref:CsbD family protein n=1 Tax=Lamprobacter modestohalophilus TaxID=1064514 RepID=UPI002ADEE0C7|nr:CsbD family protein [Lamprobacter modestohalophilus]MEA1051927.1 CsbD family protein [Lamprobacter modestohalophilus]
MNKKQVKGHYEEAKGAVKEATGKLTGNEELELKGKIQKEAGKIQAGVGDVEQEVKDNS